MNPLPRMHRVRQLFPPTPALHIRDTLAATFPQILPLLPPGAPIAVGVGSRGITGLADIVRAVLDELRAAGTRPFIIPAMGSHGGATSEGQREILAGYGITEPAMGVPIRAAMETRQIGTTPQGVPVHCSTVALAAGGILLINRIKPHTDFSGGLGSGLLKMAAIGLGKRPGATAMHLGATQFGYEPVIRAMARVLLEKTPLLGGIAILEDQHHRTARLLAIGREAMPTAEDTLLPQARALMPTLPFQEIDLLIIDRIGKNISGTGLDPNVINRSIHGYDSLPIRGDRPAPFIRRIFVRDLTPETHGNAIGIGLADATTTRLQRETDPLITRINALTALTPQSAKMPIAFDTDDEAIQHLLASLPLRDPALARIVHITDTLSLTDLEISQALLEEITTDPALSARFEV